MSRFAFGSVIAASALLGAVLAPLPALARLATDDWGWTCSQLSTPESKKECCVTTQTDCNAECFGNYHDEALKTCQKLCTEKGNKCREEIKGETSGEAQPDE